MPKQGIMYARCHANAPMCSANHPLSDTRHSALAILRPTMALDDHMASSGITASTVSVPRRAERPAGRPNVSVAREVAEEGGIPNGDGRGGDTHATLRKNAW